MILRLQFFHDSGYPWYTACIKSINTVSWHVAAHNSCSLVGLASDVLMIWCMSMVFRFVSALDPIGNGDTWKSASTIMLALTVNILCVHCIVLA